MHATGEKWGIEVSERDLALQLGQEGTERHPVLALDETHPGRAGGHFLKASEGPRGGIVPARPHEPDRRKLHETNRALPRLAGANYSV